MINPCLVINISLKISELKQLFEAGKYWVWMFGLLDKFNCFTMEKFRKVLTIYTSIKLNVRQRRHLSKLEVRCTVYTYGVWDLAQYLQHYFINLQYFSTMIYFSNICDLQFFMIYLKWKNLCIFCIPSFEWKNGNHKW